MKYPEPPFRHLQRLTDNIGLLQHADGVVPLYADGYSVENVALGLLVVCRELSPPQQLVVLGRRYLYFLAQAQVLGGKFRNHLGYDRQWHGQPSTEDGWGCSLWALGTAAARGPTKGIREESFTRFNRGAQVSSPSAHAMAFAALGAAEILDSHPGHHAALALLYRAHVAIGGPAADARWPWPLPRLSYANAAIAEAIIVSGRYLGEDRLLRNGLRMLEWLLATETRDGHLSVVSPQGWGPDEERRPASDQRPVEVAALADACMRAATVTGDDGWLAGVRMCIAWFLGDNDAGVPLLDKRTGGCSDGLTGAGRSRNQGAESTRAMIAVLQHGHRLVAPPEPPEPGLEAAPPSPATRGGICRPGFPQRSEHVVRHHRHHRGDRGLHGTAQARVTLATRHGDPPPRRRARHLRRAMHGLTAAERITQMKDGKLAAAPGQEISRLRCREIIRTDRGWERCHRDEHDPCARHHVRDRSWLSAENTPRLRLGQPCGAACTWPDLVIPYRSGTGRTR